MSDLGKKLDGLLEWRSTCQDEMKATLPGIADPLYAEKVMADIRDKHKKQTIEGVKQVFVDAGWMPLNAKEGDYIQVNRKEYQLDGGNITEIERMTGQEFYDRFEKEMSRLHADGSEGVRKEWNYTLQAAKKAAGIE